MSRRYIIEDYDKFIKTHTLNAQKHKIIGKKIYRLQKQVDRLKSTLDNLSDINMRNMLILSLHEKQVKDVSYTDYAIKCIYWCKVNDFHTDFTDMKTSNIIEFCHRNYNTVLLKGFTFVLHKECSLNGCMSWTYGSPTCSCGKTIITYDDGIDYINDICLDDKTPIYSLVIQ